MYVLFCVVFIKVLQLVSDFYIKTSASLLICNLFTRKYLKITEEVVFNLHINPSIPFKSLSIRDNTLAKFFFPLFETVFMYTCRMLNSACLVFFFALFTSVKLFPLWCFFILEKKKTEVTLIQNG